MAKGISILLLFLCVSYAIGNDAPAVQNEDNGLKLANENEDASKLQNDEEYDQAQDLDEGAQSEEDESNFEAEETTEADEQGEEAFAENENAEENDNTEVASNEDNVNEEGCKWRYVKVRSYYNVPQYRTIRYSRCSPYRKTFICIRYGLRAYRVKVPKKYCYWKVINGKKTYYCTYRYVLVTKYRHVKQRANCTRIRCRYYRQSFRYLSRYSLRTRITRKRLCL